MKLKLDAGLVKEVEHVHDDSKELLQQLINLYFPDNNVEVIPERPYSCKITNRLADSIVFIGKTDAVIKSTECDFAVLCWEIKNQLNSLGRGEIAQTAAEISGELEAMFHRFNVKPRRYAGVLTNGRHFVFTMATIVNGMYSWRHSRLIDDAANAAAMMEGCFAIAVEVLQLLNESLDVPAERLQLDNKDGASSGGGSGSGGHSKRGGADDGTKTESKGAALLLGSNRARRGTTGRGSGTKSSTTKGVKATKKSITGTKTSSNSQDYRFAPLTISNVDIFNETRGSLMCNRRFMNCT